MASLLKSGVPLRRALETIRMQTTSPGMKFALQAVMSDIEGGSRLSDSLERHPTVFPPFYTRLIRVGEATGGLINTFGRLGETLQRRKAIQDKVRGALTYPLISLLVAGVAGIILVTVSLPALIGLLDEIGGELPLTTRILQFGAAFLQDYLLHLIGTLAAILVLIVLYFRTPKGARVRDRMLLKMPVIGGVVQRSSMHALTSTLKNLIDEGVPLMESLRLSADSVGNLIIRDALQSAIAQAEGGMSLGQAFREQEIFPPLFTQGVVTGEVSGTLAETLGGLAEFYQQESERSIGAATELIQPAIILIVAGVVGFVAVAVLSGIYSTLGSVANQ
jgi:type IV pilus assembly protein PilC